MLILLSCNHISTPFAFLLATFLLTHPLRGATNGYLGISSWAFISTHTPLTGCNSIPDDGKMETRISTHTPLTGCNSYNIPVVSTVAISTHTPLTGCNLKTTDRVSQFAISTHTPLTGCNAVNSVTGSSSGNFYSHTPHGVQPYISSF